MELSLPQKYLELIALNIGGRTYEDLIGVSCCTIDLKQRFFKCLTFLQQHHQQDSVGVRVDGEDSGGVRVDGEDSVGVRVDGEDSGGVRVDGEDSGGVRVDGEDSVGVRVDGEVGGMVIAYKVQGGHLR